MAELEVLEGAEKVLDKRGYDWGNFGWEDDTRALNRDALCLGGAVAATLGVVDRDAKHAACLRLVNCLPKKNTFYMSPDRDTIDDISWATANVKEGEVRKALSRAIADCRQLTAV